MTYQERKTLIKEFAETRIISVEKGFLSLEEAYEEYKKWEATKLSEVPPPKLSDFARMITPHLGPFIDRRWKGKKIKILPLTEN